MPNNALIPVFDGHNDTLLNLIEPGRGKGRSFFVESEIGHIDLPRAMRGGFAGGFFAMFTPKPDNDQKVSADSDKDRVNSFLNTALTPVAHTVALAKTMAMARLMYQIEEEAKGQVRIVRDISALTSCFDDNVLAMIFHIEGAEAIDEGLDALYVLYEAGLRSLGIVWSRPNVFGHGVPFTFPGSPDRGPGLTEAGMALLKACNALGVMIDVSHLNEKGFWDVVNKTQHPVVATHSGVHQLCPSPRNLTDKQLDAIKESNGLVGVNFHVGFLREDGEQNADTPIEVLVQHVQYVVDRLGVDHVALGSDFDGAMMPETLKDVAGLPKIIELLYAGGYTKAEIEKIAYKNWLRVLGDTWK